MTVALLPRGVPAVKAGGPGALKKESTASRWERRFRLPHPGRLDRTHPAGGQPRSRPRRSTGTARPGRTVRFKAIDLLAGKASPPCRSSTGTRARFTPRIPNPKSSSPAAQNQAQARRELSGRLLRSCPARRCSARPTTRLLPGTEARRSGCVFALAILSPRMPFADRSAGPGLSRGHDPAPACGLPRSFALGRRTMISPVPDQPLGPGH